MNPAEKKTYTGGVISKVVEAVVKVAFRKQIEPNGFTIGDLAKVSEEATAKAHKRAMETSVELITEVDGYLCSSVGNEPKVRIRKLQKPKKMLPLQFNFR